jgi:hypothetical protein
MSAKSVKVGILHSTAHLTPMNFKCTSFPRREEPEAQPVGAIVHYQPITSVQHVNLTIKPQENACSPRATALAEIVLCAIILCRDTVGVQVLP